MATLARTGPTTRGVNRFSRLAVGLVQWGVAVLAFALVVFPTWPIVYQSFLAQPLYEAGQALTLSNYPRVLTNPAIWRVIGNTAIYMIGSTLIGTLVGIFFAVLLTRTNLPGRTLFSGMITIPYYVSALILAFAWRVMYGPQGFITVAVGQLGLPKWNLYSMGGLMLVSALYFMPLTYLYCSSSLRLADPQLENAARISGARPLRVLRAITLPLIRPGLFAGWLLVFVPVIQELSASILLFSSSSITLAVAVYNLYETGYIEPVAALAIVNMIIIGAAIFIANKLGGGKIASRSGASQGPAS